MTARKATMHRHPSPARGPIGRIKMRIERYITELSQLEKEGNANCDRAKELREWVWADERELKKYIQ